MSDAEDYAKENFQRVLKFGYEPTVCPEVVNIEWSYGASYRLDTVSDGSSLLWIPVLQDTFNELYSEHEWTVDDPGTIYSDDEREWVEDSEESPYDMDRLQNITVEAVSRYCHLVKMLEEAGVEVVDDKG